MAYHAILHPRDEDVFPPLPSLALDPSPPRPVPCRPIGRWSNSNNNSKNSSGHNNSNNNSNQHSSIFIGNAASSSSSAPKHRARAPSFAEVHAFDARGLAGEDFQDGSEDWRSSSNPTFKAPERARSNPTFGLPEHFSSSRNFQAPEGDTRGDRGSSSDQNWIGTRNFREDVGPRSGIGTGIGTGIVLQSGAGNLGGGVGGCRDQASRRLEVAGGMKTRAGQEARDEAQKDPMAARREDEQEGKVLKVARREDEQEGKGRKGDLPWYEVDFEKTKQLMEQPSHELMGFRQDRPPPLRRYLFGSPNDSAQMDEPAKGGGGGGMVDKVVETPPFKGTYPNVFGTDGRQSLSLQEPDPLDATQPSPGPTTAATATAPADEEDGLAEEERREGVEFEAVRERRGGEGRPGGADDHNNTRTPYDDDAEKAVLGGGSWGRNPGLSSNLGKSRFQAQTSPTRPGVFELGHPERGQDHDSGPGQGQGPDGHLSWRAKRNLSRRDLSPKLGAAKKDTYVSTSEMFMKSLSRSTSPKPSIHPKPWTPTSIKPERPDSSLGPPSPHSPRSPRSPRGGRGHPSPSPSSSSPVRSMSRGAAASTTRASSTTATISASATASAPASNAARPAQTLQSGSRGRGDGQQRNSNSNSYGDDNESNGRESEDVEKTETKRRQDDSSNNKSNNSTDKRRQSDEQAGEEPSVVAENSADEPTTPPSRSQSQRHQAHIQSVLARKFAHSPSSGRREPLEGPRPSTPPRRRKESIDGIFERQYAERLVREEQAAKLREERERELSQLTRFPPAAAASAGQNYQDVQSRFLRKQNEHLKKRERFQLDAQKERQEDEEKYVQQHTVHRRTSLTMEEVDRCTSRLHNVYPERKERKLQQMRKEADEYELEELQANSIHRKAAADSKPSPSPATRAKIVTRLYDLDVARRQRQAGERWQGKVQEEEEELSRLDAESIHAAAARAGLTEDQFKQLVSRLHSGRGPQGGISPRLALGLQAEASTSSRGSTPRGGISQRSGGTPPSSARRSKPAADEVSPTSFRGSLGSVSTIALARHFAGLEVDRVGGGGGEGERSRSKGSKALASNGNNNNNDSRSRIGKGSSSGRRQPPQGLSSQQLQQLRELRALQSSRGEPLPRQEGSDAEDEEDEEGEEDEEAFLEDEIHNLDDMIKEKRRSIENDRSVAREPQGLSETRRDRDHSLDMPRQREAPWPHERPDDYHQRNGSSLGRPNNNGSNIRRSSSSSFQRNSSFNNNIHTNINSNNNSNNQSGRPASAKPSWRGGGVAPATTSQGRRASTGSSPRGASAVSPPSPRRRDSTPLLLVPTGKKNQASPGPSRAQPSSRPSAPTLADKVQQRRAEVEHGPSPVHAVLDLGPSPQASPGSQSRAFPGARPPGLQHLINPRTE